MGQRPSTVDSLPLLGASPKAPAIHFAFGGQHLGLTMGPRDVTLLGERVLLEFEFGEWEQGESYLERLVETIPGGEAAPDIRLAGPAAILPYIARITGSFDHLDIAVAAAEKVLGSSNAEPIFANFARMGLGLVAVLRRNITLAEAQYTQLASGVEWLGASGMHSQRLMGLLAQTMGNPDQATVHYEACLAFCRKAGYRPELAWTCCDYADLLLDPATSSGRAVSDNRTKAMALLDESLAISSELGMRPLMERVLSRREILKA